jgi:hypothetical protein
VTLSGIDRIFSGATDGVLLKPADLKLGVQRKAIVASLC